MMMPDPEKSRAVLIGVHRYMHLSPLPAVKRNLRDLQRLLTDDDLFGLPPEHCHKLLHPDTAEQVLDTLHRVAAEAQDTLLVYYAGHGLTNPHRGDELCLALPRSDPKRPYSALRYDDLRQVVLDLSVPALRKVVIIDCCFSGRALVGGMSSPVFADISEIGGTCVITASAETRTALAPPGEAHTAFTGELIGAIESGIPGAAEFLDTETLYRHALAQLRAKGRPLPQQRNRNTGGKIILARNRAYATETPREDVHDIRSIAALPHTQAEIDAALEGRTDVNERFAQGRLVRSASGWRILGGALPAVLGTLIAYLLDATSILDFGTLVGTYKFGYVLIALWVIQFYWLVPREFRLPYRSKLSYVSGRRPERPKRSEIHWPVRRGAKFSVRMKPQKPMDLQYHVGGQLMLITYECDATVRWAMGAAGTILVRGVLSTHGDPGINDGETHFDVPHRNACFDGARYSRLFSSKEVGVNLTEVTFPDRELPCPDGEEATLDLFVHRTDEGPTLAYLHWIDPSIHVGRGWAPYRGEDTTLRN